MRIGGAGIMLPHYAPLKVAEQFRVLDALAPRRSRSLLARFRRERRSESSSCADNRAWIGRGDGGSASPACRGVRGR
jgi:hypothetical protein